MSFEIIKNAPPPPPNAGRGGRTIYPFANMEVGDAFDAPRDMGCGKSGTDKRQISISTCARGFVLKHNPTWKFTTYLLDKHTVRCWRIA